MNIKGLVTVIQKGILELAKKKGLKTNFCEKAAPIHIRKEAAFKLEYRKFGREVKDRYTFSGMTVGYLEKCINHSE